MTEPSNQSSYVTPRFNKTRMDAQWTRIAERLPKSPRRGRGQVLQLVGAFTVVCALAMVWWWSEERDGTRSVWEGSLVASDDAPVNFTLAEGTLIELDPRSEVELLHSGQRSVQLALRSGSARFDVAKRRTRRFSVNLGEVEVLVTGTTFRLRRNRATGGERVRVEVEEGSVEVRRGTATVRLGAGERWSAFVSAHEPEAADTEREETQQETEESPESSGASSALADEPVTAHAEDAAREDVRRPRKRAHAEQPDPGELFDRANIARRLGRLKEAADSYADLVARYPKDRRAALAAFELGRIRMDSLSDLRGATDALERALRLDARRAFAEDALARLVLAQDALKNRQACESARERYLSRYPDGVHAQHLAERCTGR